MYNYSHYTVIIILLSWYYYHYIIIAIIVIVIITIIMVVKTRMHVCGRQGAEQGATIRKGHDQTEAAGILAKDACRSSTLTWHVSHLLEICLGSLLLYHSADRTEPQTK